LATGPEPERWRVFFAIELPAAVRGALQPAIDDLGTLQSSLGLNAVERIHLTLHFLGHLPVPDIERLTPRVARAVAQHHRMRLSVHGVGAFPSFGRPQVLWAGVAGDDLTGLTGLQRALGQALASAGIPLEQKEPFHPHLTLARVRRPIRGAGRKRLADWKAHWQDVEFGKLPVRDVRLMRSQLGAGPPRYSVLQTFSLQ
jgi:2'-5' RNA ligase